MQFAEGVVQVTGVNGLREELSRRQASPDQVMVWKPGLPGWVAAKNVMA